MRDCVTDDGDSRHVRADIEGNAKFDRRLICTVLGLVDAGVDELNHGGVYGCNGPMLKPRGSALKLCHAKRLLLGNRIVGKFPVELLYANRITVAVGVRECITLRHRTPSDPSNRLGESVHDVAYFGEAARVRALPIQ